VRRKKSKTDIIANLLSEGFIPILPNIGWSGTGKPYNISPQSLPSRLPRHFTPPSFSSLPISVVFRRMVLRRRPAWMFPDNIISQLTAPQAKCFLDLNRKREKSHHYEIVSLAYRACQAGIERTHVIDGREDGMLLKEFFPTAALAR